MISKYHRAQSKLVKVNNKWKPVLLLLLLKGGKRFNSLKTILLISGKVLTTNLVELGHIGLIKIINSKYTLTTKGHQLATLYLAIIEIL